MDFSDYLCKTRFFYGLTLSQLSERIDYSIGHINDIEKKRKPASDKFKATVRREFPRNEAFDRFLYAEKEGEHQWLMK
ncbi:MULTISPECIES: helix-turn-helix domain-containing protein [Lysinibacillus]|uniref:helix-turn-helix domain-containing protein n=1 Tax=Lysinibacillus TaxID=400634 RepID=UPI00315AE3E3